MTDLSISGLPHPNWIEIDLDALKSNIAVLQKRVGANVKILLPVKADAYGHGSLACSFTAAHSGVYMLGVAHLFEGVLLRQYGVKLPILVFTPAEADEAEFYRKAKLTATVSSLENARELSDAAGSDPLPVHLKLDTGMGRFGELEAPQKFMETAACLSGISVTGIYSHMAVADEKNHPLNKKQLSSFAEIRKLGESRFGEDTLWHLANSAAVFSFPESHHQMIRPGIASYGYSSSPQVPTGILRPVLRMFATVRQIKRVSRGQSISYGATWTAKHDTLVAAISIGYGDGYFRGLEGGCIFIRGLACPILGRVCMDTVMVDVSALPELKKGEVATVIDGEKYNDISMEKLAGRMNTIPYELSCRVARRLYRRYIWKKKKWRWDELKKDLGVRDFRPEL